VCACVCVCVCVCRGVCVRDREGSPGLSPIFKTCVGGAGKSKVKHPTETEEPGTQLTLNTFHIHPRTSTREMVQNPLCAPTSATTS